MYEDDNNDKINPLDRFWLEGDSLAPPCQCDIDVIESILKFANINESSYLYDLGCGDGRICIHASKLYKCKSFGCEIEDYLIKKFIDNIDIYQLNHLVDYFHGDLTTLDIINNSIVVIYLLPESIDIIKEKLIDALTRDCIIICNTWGIKGLIPVDRISCGYCNNTTLIKYDKSCLNNL